MGRRQKLQSLIIIGAGCAWGAIAGVTGVSTGVSMAGGLFVGIAASRLARLVR